MCNLPRNYLLLLNPKILHYHLKSRLQDSIQNQFCSVHILLNSHPLRSLLKSSSLYIPKIRFNIILTSIFWRPKLPFPLTTNLYMFFLFFFVSDTTLKNPTVLYLFIKIIFKKRDGLKAVR